jgi:hypothetical protein
VNSPPLRGIAPVGLRPLCAMPRNGNRWKGLVGNPSIGTETLFRPSRLPQRAVAKQESKSPAYLRCPLKTVTWLSALTRAAASRSTRTQPVVWVATTIIPPTAGCSYHCQSDRFGPVWQ